MLAPDLHPEELLDRVRAGRATDEDTARWSEHLSHCAVCRLEQQLKADFGAEDASAPGSAPNRLLLASVLEHALPRPELDAPTSVPPVAEAPASPASRRLAGSRRRSRLLAALVAALAATLLGTLVAAAASSGWAPWGARGPGRAPVDSAGLRAAGGLFARVPQRSSPGASAAGGGAIAGTAVPAGGEPAPGSSALGALGVPEVEPLGVAPRAHADARAGGAAGSPELFRAANAARRGGDLARARSLYRQLIEHHGTSPEARVARAVLARLALDQGRAGEAVDDYDAYLAGGSAPLSEAALVGRAVALEQSGRRAEARAAWQALLRAHPHTPHRVRAQGRIAALAGP
ncbi:MAG: tetratricopeptide repeat protein [Polyangiaceae bacterium]|nr:tetratricopeptide repeat protein [Polyangiaceae bacterium]